ncbi:hypothetical protein C8N36_107100 [Pelagimonas varians]|uniref:Sulfotransferase domain-containing protein n=1 Tax=Pelagimonas varians TaxID=696760 RepID=A0A238KD33_9RHOB|nr:hypothetical protein C8N36_107100 [Pelagimonas varians]SMX40719.1 hypothetical protein PEV8663_02095 [Pelagimonas varians]
MVQDTTILLHLGTHKTGTTTLQQSFAAARQALRSRDVVFLGPGNSYPHLYSAFLTDPMIFPWNRLSGLTVDQIRDRDRKAMNELAAALDRNRGKTIILSNEYLAMLPPEQMTALRDFLSPHGQVHAVYVYRELHSWLGSNTQQMVKAGLSSRGTSFATGLKRVGDFPLKVAQVFGRENSTFLRFEDLIREGVADTFLGHFNLPTLTEIGCTEQIANTAVSGPAVSALMVYNRDFPTGHADRDPQQVARLMALPGEKYRAAALRPNDIRAYSAMRDKVQAELGLRLAPPEALPLLPHPRLIRLRRMAERMKRRLLRL